MSFGYQVLGFGSGGNGFTGDAEYLVVGGGGSGGSCPLNWTTTGGGGGAGGYRTNYGGVAASLTEGEVVYTATVGTGSPGRAGGQVNQPNGLNSTLIGTGVSISATGGGVGGGEDAAGGRTSDSPPGGSGGGDGCVPLVGVGVGNAGGNGGSPSIPEGFDGGLGDTGYQSAAGGGGGASEVGFAATGSSPNGIGGLGGDGLANEITGDTPIPKYAGGGGGCPNDGASSAVAGGAGGGGDGASRGGGSVTGGTANFGGGGGGTENAQTSGAGGLGVVILRVPTSEYSGVTSGSPTVSTVGADTVIKFTGTGSYTTPAA